MMTAALLAVLLAQEPSPTMREVQERLSRRFLPMPAAADPAEWEKIATRMRAEVLEKIVYRGEAARWRDLPPRVVWGPDVAGTKGYRLRKLRYEAVPGLWIPALLYLPEPLAGKVPVHLALSGHEKDSKAVGYAQVRYLNLARRGMIVLAPDWLGMGQLRGPGYAHYALNQLDLCGTSGLAPFYLSMKRGLDVLLALENADPARVAVHGLSGGGWQTIWITALDTRVTLSNPVAGYSSLRTMTRHLKDLPDSEQSPSDFATVADYAHFTALCAPRPTLLTYNLKDDCCYESDYALSPLVDAAQPIFRLYGREERLRTHVNKDPGTHNYLRENREALYRFVGDHFFAGDATFDANEIPCDRDLRTPAELAVDLPSDNATLLSLAKSLASSLPRDGERSAARLRSLLRAAGVKVASAAGERFDFDDGFTVFKAEFPPAKPGANVLLLADSGARSLTDEARKRAAAGERVVVVDPLGFGDSKIPKHHADFTLLLQTAGERPLGIESMQVAAVARWMGGDVAVIASGPRSTLVALAAAALEEKAISRLELTGCLGSLKDVLDQGLTYEKAPEFFCFGLLEAFDIPQIVALIAPRPFRMK